MVICLYAVLNVFVMFSLWLHIASLLQRGITGYLYSWCYIHTLHLTLP